MLQIWPPLKSFIKNVWYLCFTLRGGLWRAFWRGEQGIPPADAMRYRKWNTAIPFVESAAELRDWLRGNGISLVDAEHALYIPPQENLATVFPELVRFYPANSGFKILKDLRPPDRANYLAGRAGSVAIRRRLTGSPAEHVTTANYIHWLGFGPRMWDVCGLNGNGTELTLFVVDHIEGTVPSDEACQAFLTDLARLISESHLRILIRNWKQQDDFECPGCRGNLFHSIDHASVQYVDFQNFRLSDPAHWTREIESVADESDLANDLQRHSYAAELLALLTDAGVDLQDRVVMHVRCGLGDILIEATNCGAAWCFGWIADRALQNASAYLFSQGLSRFALNGMGKSDASRFGDNIAQTVHNRLSESILICQFDDSHADEFSNYVQEIPWQVLVCISETRQNVTETIAHQLEEFPFDAMLLSATTLVDALGEDVAIAIYSRE